MSQIDYIFKTADKATAIADAQFLINTYTDAQSVKQFAQDHCLETTVWRNSQDTTTTDGLGNIVPVHHPLAGYFFIVSLDRVVPALLNHAAVQLVVDRDKMNARQAGAVLKSGVTNAVLQDIRISPVFSGMDCPWGGFS